MAYYKPCKNCAVDKAACSRRAKVADAIAGMSITVVNFRCSDRRGLFHAGQRVRFVWTYWERGDGYGDEGFPLVFHGTVIEESGLRFIIRVDDGPSASDAEMSARNVFKSDTLVIKVKPVDMHQLNEPDRPLCPACSAYDGENDRCQGWEDKGYASYWPTGCLNRLTKKSEIPTDEVAF